MYHIAIFASGKGSNADSICSYFQQHPSIMVSAIYSNKQEAGVHQVAKKYGVPSFYISPEILKNPLQLLEFISDHRVDFIILAGYLKQISPELIAAYPDKIINIHPALLPKFGGKGMYGSNVHQAVAEAGETESGISIHLVNEKYDEGKIIFQAKTPVEKGDSPQRIAEKVLELEHRHFAPVIEKYILEFAGNR